MYFPYETVSIKVQKSKQNFNFNYTFLNINYIYIKCIINEILMDALNGYEFKSEGTERHVNHVFIAVSDWMATRVAKD